MKKFRNGRAVIVLIIVLAITLFLVQQKSPTTDEINTDNDFLEAAIQSGDMRGCKSIQHNDIKDRCFLELATSPEDCSSIKDPRGMNACLATVFNTGEDCKSISEVFYADICNKRVALNLNESTVCENIKYREDRNDCFKLIALRTNDQQLCDKLKGLPISHCKKDIAFIQLDISLCENVDNAVIRAICQGKIAEGLGENTLCNKISISDIRQTCFERVNATVKV